jgi:cation transport ATPase-like protein
MPDRRRPRPRRVPKAMNPGTIADQGLDATLDAPEAAPPWHQMSIEPTLEALKSSLQRLEAQEGQRRLAAIGPNELTQGKRRTPLRMCLEQFTDFMILMLRVAAVILRRHNLDICAVAGHYLSANPQRRFQDGALKLVRVSDNPRHGGGRVRRCGGREMGEAQRLRREARRRWV